MEKKPTTSTDRAEPQCRSRRIFSLCLATDNLGGSRFRRAKPLCWWWVQPVGFATRRSLAPPRNRTRLPYAPCVLFSRNSHLHQQRRASILITVEETTFMPTLTALSGRYGRLFRFLPPALFLPLTITEPFSPTS